MRQPVEQKAYSLNSPDFAELVGAVSPFPKINVGGLSALYVPAVLQAVRLISESVGSLPCKVYRDLGDHKDVAKDHPAYRIVHKRANE